MNKTINVTGKIFHRTDVRDSGEGSNQGKGFLTLEVEKTYTNREGEDKVMLLYYQVETFRKTDILDIRVGYEVEMTIEVEGNLWKDKDTGEPKMGKSNLWINKQQESFDVPMVFTKMTLREMRVIKESQEEAVVKNNKGVEASFTPEPEDDLPFMFAVPLGLGLLSMSQYAADYFIM